MQNLHKTLDACYSQGSKIVPGCFLILLFLFISLLGQNAVLGQSSESLVVRPLDTSRFPEISVSFKLPTNQREIISDLGLNQMMVFENDEPVQPESLNKVKSGVHFTLAINPGTRLDLHDMDGVSSYQKLRDVLIGWAEERSSLIGDAWSFVGDSGILIGNSKDKDLWIDALNGYQPNFRSLTPQLTSLDLALELSSERVVPFGVDKSILYITPAPLPDQIKAINDLSNQASSAGVQVNVWMIDEAYFLTNDQGGALIDLANNTGGYFFHYTGSEIIPNPENYLVDLGYYFTLSYPSKIRDTGTNSLRIVWSSPDGEISGESPPYFVEVNPPNPILVSPPSVINRAQSELQIGEFYPTNQQVEFMVEFPDHHPRPISTSRLIVDGEIIEERIDSSLDPLSWDLTSLLNSGEHTIQVEVEDSLGLSGRTILTPVFVEVTVPEPEQRFDPGQFGLLALSIIFGISLFILVSWLVRRYWQSDNFKSLFPARIIQDKDVGVLSSFVKDNQKDFIAKLIPLDSQIRDPEGVLHLAHSRVYIGCDPAKAELVINDLSVNDAQAIIIHSDEGFWINDLDSDSGTWVNYIKIGRQPVRVQSGDIVHFGNCGFRFSVLEYGRSQKVTYSKYEPMQ
jgi:hypothetical protein